MNSRILGGNPSREKITAAVAQPSIFYYRENILQHMCWCRLYQHAGTHLRSFTNLSWKGAPTPSLVYQPLLEGSYNPLTEGYNPQHHHGPHFINFHTGSKASFRTQLAGHFSLYFQTGPTPHVQAQSYIKTDTYQFKQLRSVEYR